MGITRGATYFDKLPVLSEEQVRDYLGQFLVLSADQLDQAAAVLYGRARFSALFVVWCLMSHGSEINSAGGGAFPLEWFKQQMTTSEGLRTDDSKSFLGDKIFTPYGLLDELGKRPAVHKGVDLWQRVKAASIHYKVFGVPYLFHKYEDLELVEVGVAPLVKFGRGGPGGQQAALSEPLMLFAAESAFDVLDELQRLLAKLQVHASSTGFVMEHLLAVALRKLFSGDTALEELPLFGGGGNLPEPFCGKWKMELGDVFVKTSTTQFNFIAFLEQRSPMYFIPENKAGPDGAFWLKLGDKWVLVVLQSKFAGDFNVERALETISPRTFFTAKKANTTSKASEKGEETKQNNLKELREKAARLIGDVGLISILVCLPGNAPRALTSGLTQRDDGSLLLVIDSTNAGNLFGSDVLAFFQNLKTF
jgi:hypothetical protein